MFINSFYYLFSDDIFRAELIVKQIRSFVSEVGRFRAAMLSPNY